MREFEKPILEDKRRINATRVTKSDQRTTVIPTKQYLGLRAPSYLCPMAWLHRLMDVSFIRMFQHEIYYFHAPRMRNGYARDSAGENCLSFSETHLDAKLR